MDEKKCVAIRLEFDDGSVRESASAEDASAIFLHWVSGETMNWIHGERYNGPMLVETRLPSTSADRLGRGE